MLTPIPRPTCQIAAALAALPPDAPRAARIALLLEMADRGPGEARHDRAFGVAMRTGQDVDDVLDAWDNADGW